MGVIDAIAEGCLTVARRPWVILPLVVLDLLYWLGGRLSAAPLIAPLIALVEWAQRQNAPVPDPNGMLPPGPVEQGQVPIDLAEQLAQLRELQGQLDLFGLFSLGQGPLLPQLGREAVGRAWSVGVLDLGQGWLTALAALGLILLGILWLALSLALVATLVRDEPFAPQQVVRQTLRCWGRLLGLIGLILAGLLVLGVPLLFLATLLQLLGLSPGVPILLMIIPLLLALIYLNFTPDAIAVSQVGPFRAIKLSVAVVRRNFWSLVRLLLTFWVLSAGFPLAWGLLARQVAGVPLAIVGNAFLNTGLLAAGMIFYRERLAALDRPAEATKPPKRPFPPPPGPQGRR